MFFEIFVAILCGVLIGTFTGLLPGVHVNLVSVILFGAVPVLARFVSFELVAVIIVSMSVTHAFVDFIPAVFLGAVSEGTALSAMPANSYLLGGFGLDAVRLSAYGSVFGLVSVVLFFPVIAWVASFIYSYLREFVWVVLLLSCIFLFGKNPFWNILSFILSGILGFVVLKMGINEPLLPMLSGFFGISLLLYNLGRDVSVPIQHAVEMIDIGIRDFSKAVFLGLASGSLVGIFPALGPSHSAAIAERFSGNPGRASRLVMLGAISTVSVLMSLVTLYSFGKARNGSIVVMADIVGELSVNLLLILLGSALVAGFMALFFVLAIGRLFSRCIDKVNYSVVSIFVMAFVVLLVLVFSGWIGILVLVTSAAIGVIPIIKGCNRSSAMGCLIVPVIIYYIS
ncbi:tripartite tricarboxylate transporter permease [Candidatus Woesearchaeota archaeon]|nr:tripartite tricarboxylate transporter permease [Candidatus Woesearchaeota archaeon]